MAFNKLLNDLEVIEIQPSNGRFSWSNFRQISSLARLDRCFVNTSWHKIYPLTICSFLSRVTSDHTPLKIDMLPHPKRNKGVRKPFRFNNIWYSYPDFENIVKESWMRNVLSTGLASIIVLKLRRLSADIRKWKREIVEDIFQLKKELTNKIKAMDIQEEEKSLSAEEKMQQSDLKSKLAGVISQEEMYWCKDQEFNG